MKEHPASLWVICGRHVESPSVSDFIARDYKLEKYTNFSRCWVGTDLICQKTLPQWGIEPSPHTVVRFQTSYFKTCVSCFHNCLKFTSVQLQMQAFDNVHCIKLCLCLHSYNLYADISIINSPWCNRLRSPRACQPTTGLDSTFLQTEMKDHLASLGVICGRQVESSSVLAS